MLCSKCKKRQAVVFVAGFFGDRKTENTGLCLTCARRLGIPQVEEFIKGMGMDIDDVEEELMGLVKTLGGVVEGNCIPQLFIPKLIHYYKEGKFPFDKLIKYYRFEDINQAFADTKRGEVIKAVLLMD